MDKILEYILENGDLKVILLIAILIAYRQFARLESALRDIAKELNDFRTKEECDFRHESCIRRIEALEKEVHRK